MVVKYGETPEYTGDTFFKSSTADYNFPFDGWDSLIVPATTNHTYTATYCSKLSVSVLFRQIE